MSARRDKKTPVITTPERPYRERRVKFFVCHGARHAGKPYRATSLRKDRAMTGLCRACRRGVDTNLNQTDIFGATFETPCESGGMRHREGCAHDAATAAAAEACVSP